MGFWNKFEEGKLWVKVKDNKNNELVSFLSEAEKAGFELPGSPYILSNYLNDFYFHAKKDIVITYHKDSLIFTYEDKFNETLENSEKKDLFLWDWGINDALMLPAFETFSDEFDEALNIMLCDNLCDEEDNNEEDFIEEPVDEIHICSCKDRADDCSSPSDHCQGCDKHIEGKTTSGVVDNCCEDETENSCEIEDENEVEKMRESLRTIYNHLKDYGYEEIFIDFFIGLAAAIAKDFNSGDDFYG